MSNTKTAAEEWKAHWPVVVAACVGFSFTSLMTPAVGVFMEPLAGAFGWSRTQLSTGLALCAVLSLFISPFCGALIDRFGTRRVAFPGIILTALATAAFSLASGSFLQWMGLWAVWGLACLLIQATLWSAAVASLFESGRGLALGITFSGAALAQVIVPPLANELIQTYGWRMAYILLGIGWGGIALLLSAFFLFDARDQRRRMARNNQQASAETQLPGLTIAEAKRNTQLWRVAAATFLTLTVTIAVSVHQFPILVEATSNRATAAWIASMVGVAGVIGKIVTGWLIDRFHARWVGGITLASTAIAYPLLLESFRTPTLIVVAILVSGYAAGTKIQLSGYLTARYAGMRNYGAIFGFISSMIALASGVGPLFAGWSHDVYGSYALLLIVGTVMSLVSGALIFSLGPYPVWTQPADAEATAPNDINAAAKV
jgi:predicted MFS family arabinose efflux permease